MDQTQRLAFLNRLVAILRLAFWMISIIAIIFGNLPWGLSMGPLPTFQVAGWPRRYWIYQIEQPSGNSYYWFSLASLLLNAIILVAVFLLVLFRWRGWFGKDGLWKWSIIEILALMLLVGSFQAWLSEREPFRKTMSESSKGRQISYRKAYWNLERETTRTTAVSIRDLLGTVSLPIDQSIFVQDDPDFRLRGNHPWASSLTLIQAEDEDFAYLASNSLLKTVQIEASELGPQSARWLTALPNLENLTIRFSGLDDFPMEVLSEFKRLRLLDISQTRLPNGVYCGLGSIKSLKRLVVATNQPPKQFYEAFQHHPNLEVLEFQTSFDRPTLNGGSEDKGELSINLYDVPKLREIQILGTKRLHLRLRNLPNLGHFHRDQVAENNGLRTIDLPVELLTCEIEDCPALELKARVELNSGSHYQFKNLERLNVDAYCDNDTAALKHFMRGLGKRVATEIELGVWSKGTAELDLEDLPANLYALKLYVKRKENSIPPESVLKNLTALEIDTEISSDQFQKCLSQGLLLRHLDVELADSQFTIEHPLLEHLIVRPIGPYDGSRTVRLKMDVRNCPNLKDIVARGMIQSSFGIDNAPNLTNIYTNGHPLLHALRGKIALSQISIDDSFNLVDPQELEFTVKDNRIMYLSLSNVSAEKAETFLTRIRFPEIIILSLNATTIPPISNEVKPLSVGRVFCTSMDVDVRRLEQLLEKRGEYACTWVIERCALVCDGETNEIERASKPTYVPDLILRDSELDSSSAQWIAKHLKVHELWIEGCSGSCSKILGCLDGLPPQLKLEKLDEEMIEALSKIPDTISIEVPKVLPNAETMDRLKQHRIRLK